MSKPSKPDPARSLQMARVKGKNTGPELVVRRLVHGMSARYRLHFKGLPGTPDLVFISRRKVLQVNGCFWHMHDSPSCWRSRLPKSRLEFWSPKLKANVERDRHNLQRLAELNWDVMVVWECETTPTNQADLKLKLRNFLGLPQEKE